MSFRGILASLCGCLALALSGVQAEPAPAYNKIVVETSATSIYIGRVTLILTPLLRQGAVYSGAYRAKVFPYFFMNEHGTFHIEYTDDDLARLARGETVDFKGRAETNDAREERRITGRATPADATSGKIKVRVWVTEKIQLIFNTTYRFEATPPAAAHEESARSAEPATWQLKRMQQKPFLTRPLNAA